MIFLLFSRLKKNDIAVMTNYEICEMFCDAAKVELN